MNDRIQKAQAKPTPVAAGYRPATTEASCILCEAWDGSGYCARLRGEPSVATHYVCRLYQEKDSRG